jgi:Calcineurin-like phosphoesterase superfamily domain
VRRLHGPLSILLVVAASAAAGAGALALFTAERRLSVGEIHLSSDLGHRGSLDLYVPLVDWGVRFDGVRLPVRLRVDVRTIDRTAALRLAQAGDVDVDDVRDEATDAIRSYIVRVVLAVFGFALALGVLMAFAVRGPAFPWTVAAAVGTAVAAAAVVALLLPPRGDLSEPEYYAHGPDIPRALDALRTASAAADTLRDELDAQLVGLAQLVTAPAARDGASGLPRATIASDLHNNILALPTLERAARGGPVLFVGDLTDRGTPLETALSRRIARSGRPFLFSPGNHDSDVLLSRMSRAGAVVLGTRGRLRADGRRGEVVVRAGSLRVAGYDDPNMRRRSDGYADRGARITPDQQQEFSDWLRPLRERVDVVMVHNPALLPAALDELRADPPTRPLVFVTGHTHRAALERIGETVVVVNGGSIGGGGTGNLGEGQQVGLAQLGFRRSPFAPVTADLVEIDPASGSARAERQALGPSARE